MIDDPTPPPPIRLSPDEWKSITRRRNEMQGWPNMEEDNDWIRTKQSDAEYKRMIEALLGGAATWEVWQRENQSIEYYDFQYLVFFRQIIIKDATFNKEVFFIGTKFQGAAIFFNTIFENEVDFEDAEFNKRTNFSHTTFAKGAGFYEVKFKWVTHFNSATFKKKANFLRAEFTEWVDFQQITFDTDANFENAIFNKNAKFQRTKFIGDINFSNVTFRKDADFGQVTFDKNAIFYNVRFAEGSNFNRTIFDDEAIFLQTKFTKKTFFQFAKFNKEANFNQAIFVKEANFNQARFQSSIFFKDTKFDEKAIDFSQMILSSDSNLILAGVRFYHTVPDFRHLNRTPDIRFHRFSVPSPDELNPENKWQYDNEDRYRKLKELAIGNDNHEYELKFYGYEMDSKLRNFYKIIEKIICNKKWKMFYDKRWWGFCIKKIFCNKKWWADILPTHLYKCFSNYGQSMWQPFFYLILLAGAFYAYYLINAYNLIDWDAIFKIILPLLPFINNFNWGALLDIVKTIMPLPLFTFIDNGVRIGLISDGKLAIKMIASFFWFLFFLAMRNKFKIK